MLLQPLLSWEDMLELPLVLVKVMLSWLWEDMVMLKSQLNPLLNYSPCYISRGWTPLVRPNCKFCCFRAPWARSAQSQLGPRPSCFGDMKLLAEGCRGNGGFLGFLEVCIHKA